MNTSTTGTEPRPSEASPELDVVAMLLGTAPSRYVWQASDDDEDAEQSDGSWARKLLLDWSRDQKVSRESPNDPDPGLSALECADEFVRRDQPAVHPAFDFDAKARAAIRALLADGVLRSQRQVIKQLREQAPPTPVKAALDAGLVEGWLVVEGGPRRAHLYSLTPALKESSSYRRGLRDAAR